MSNKEQSWSCWHVFLSDAGKTEQFICECLAPLAKELISTKAMTNWFFIRYWDGGPHVRIRCQGLSDANDVQDRLTQAITKYTSDTPLTAEDYYAEHGFDGEPVDSEALEWYGEGTVARLDYEPELGRYGGPEAIAINEHLFEVSSELAVALINSTLATPTDMGVFQKRMSISLVLMAITIVAFRPSMPILAEFFANYAKFWEGYAGTAQLQDAVDAGGQRDKLTARLQQLISDTQDDKGSAMQRIWVGNIRLAVAQFRQIHEAGSLLSPMTGEATKSEADYDTAVLSMLGSQVHMLNNRLAIAPPVEYHLATKISDAARSQEAQ